VDQNPTFCICGGGIDELAKSVAERGKLTAWAANLGMLSRSTIESNPSSFFLTDVAIGAQDKNH
jgi:hypothetical protein